MTNDIFTADPDRLNATLDKQRAAVEGATPNAGHRALGEAARLRTELGGTIHLFTPTSTTCISRSGRRCTHFTAGSTVIGAPTTRAGSVLTKAV